MAAKRPPNARIPRAAAIACLVMGALLGSPASADEEVGSPREVAQSAFNRAERADRELRFREALDAYEEVGRADPTAPFAAVARVRASSLRAHSEGDFEPLAKLEAVRRDPAKNRDRASIEALLRDARGFPDGPVRGEALLVVSQAYEHALSEPDKALGALEAVLADAASDRSTRALALSEAIGLYRARGDLTGAFAAVSREPDLLPSLTREVRAEVRRVRIGRVCMAIVGGIVLLGLASGARVARRLRDVRALPSLVFRPAALGLAFYVGAGGAVFVRVHGAGGDPTPFLLLGVGIALLSGLVRLFVMGRPKSRGRAITGAVMGVIGVLAMAYLVLWRSNGASLSPLGL